MAVSPQSMPLFPLPTAEEAVALQIVGEYLSQAGTRAASSLLGQPSLDRQATLLAELSNSMLQSAALCADLVAMADERQGFDRAA